MGIKCSWCVWGWGGGECYCNTGVAESKARSCGGLEEQEHLTRREREELGEVLSGCTMTTTRRLLVISYSSVEMMWKKVLGLGSTATSKSKIALIPQQYEELQGLHFTQTGMTVYWKQRGIKRNMEEEF